MKVPSLGRLERVTLREVWDSEPGAFTPWLAQPDNVEQQEKSLESRLELEAEEKEVGRGISGAL